MGRKNTLARDFASLWFHAPLVIAARSQAMATAYLTGQSQDDTEINKMFSEKAAATAEGTQAFNKVMIEGTVAAMTAIACGRTPVSAAITGEKAAGAFIGPYAKRVRSNSHRLASDKG